MTKQTVLVETDWSSKDADLAIAARAYVKAFAFGGLNVGLVSGGVVKADASVYNEVASFLVKPPSWHAYIFGAPYSQGLVSALKTIAKNSQVPSILHTSINALNVPAPVAHAMNGIEGVLVSSQTNANTLIGSGVYRDKVFYIPPPFFPDDPYLGLADLPRKRGPIRFYSIGAWEPRKGLDRVVRAFMQGFKPGEAHLTLKLVGLSWVGSTLSPELLAADEIGTNAFVRAAGWTFEQWQANVSIIRQDLSAEEMLGLHANNDVYVSCALSEGCDMHAFRAKLAGKRLVTTTFGAAQDFAGSEDLVIPASAEVFAPETYERAKWSDYRQEDLVAALQQAPRTSRSQFDWPRESFRVSAVSKKLVRMIEKAFT